MPISRVKWLWPGKFALGKLSLIIGDPSTSKSTLLMDIIARVTSGRGWPDSRDVPNEVGNVLLLTAEDGLGDTVKPRIKAAEGDADRVFVIKYVNVIPERVSDPDARSFDLSQDIHRLDCAIDIVEDVRLICIDPLSSYLGEKTDSHRDASVRRVIEPLQDLAERRNVSVIGICHMNKKSGEGNALYRMSGSLAFVAACRTAWLVTHDRQQPGTRLVLPVKNNLAPLGNGMSFTVGTTADDDCYILWGVDPVSTTADQALTPPKGPSKLDQTAKWLTAYLSGGARKQTGVEAAAVQAGFSVGTLKRAKTSLGIKPTKAGMDEPWFWSLPEQEGAPSPRKSNDSLHVTGSECGFSEKLSALQDAQLSLSENDPLGDADGSDRLDAVDVQPPASDAFADAMGAEADQEAV